MQTLVRVALAGLGLALSVGMAPPHAAWAAEPALADSVARLTVDLDHAQALRDIKRLQYAYTQFAEYGLWQEMGNLFAAKGEWSDGTRTITGPTAIARHLAATLGQGKTGLPHGAVNVELTMNPVVVLDSGGRTARGRWQELTLRGRFGVEAGWSGGTQENDYVKENGVWKIARLRRIPQLVGNYEAGFHNATPKLPLLAYRFSSSEPGSPTPPATPAELAAAKPLPPAALARRIANLNEEDKVRNLQHIYGYYQDRKMWDDVVDLFAPDAVLEIAGLGVWRGPQGVRRALERDGPQGLKRGQVHDQIQMHTIVTVDPDGVHARARGMQFGILTPQLGQAYWMTSTYENRYVKGGDGKWRITEMRIFPTMKTDYYQGPQKSWVVDPVPKGANAPDALSSANDSPLTANVIPAFHFPNPATGRAIAMPAGFRAVGPNVAGAPASAPGVPDDLTEMRRRLEVSKAYDAIENVSSAFGYYLDDYQWQRYVENYADNGRRKKMTGEMYIGRSAIFKAESLSYGPSQPERDWIRVHNRPQPVIDVEPDAKKAYLRTRLFLYFANPRSPGSWNSGAYPNDSFVLERGVWKMLTGGWIDEVYWSSRSYKLGWAKPNEPLDAPQIGFGPSTEANVPGRNASYPADVPASALGRRADGIVRGTPHFANWPDIKPMWFHYVNPVSGRVPEFYCRDAITCGGEPVPAQ